MRKFFWCLVGLCLGGMLSDVFASTISVYPLEADLSEQVRYQDIQVHNVGTDTAYVQIEVARIDHPGQPSQKWIPLNDNPYQIGLIVTPSKVVIPVGQTRIIRALYVGAPPLSDILYRVRIAPVTGALVALSSGGKQLDAGVQLVIAYGVAIYVRPIDLKPIVTAVRHGTALSLSNVGNTSVLITSCKQCSGRGHCTAIDNLVERLYPGGNAQYTLPADLPVQCFKEVLQDQFVPFNIE